MGDQRVNRPVWDELLAPIRSVMVSALIVNRLIPQEMERRQQERCLNERQQRRNLAVSKSILEKWLITVHTVGHHHMKYLVYLALQDNSWIVLVGREMLYTCMLFSMYLYVPLRIYGKLED